MANTKTWYGNYGVSIRLTKADALNVSQAGDMSSQVCDLLQKGYVKKQADKIDPVALCDELRDYGAWDNDQLQDHKANLERLVWIAGGDIRENDRS